MRTLLNETKLIEDYLLKKAATGDALLFDAMLILDSGLREKVQWQRKTYELVQQYGRKNLKTEIEAVHQKLFNEPAHLSFRERIWSIFKY